MAPDKLETHIHVKVAAEKFYEAVSVKLYEVTKISPQLYKEAVLLHGEWGKKGCIFYCSKYVDAGKLSAAKEVIEEADRESNTIAYKMLEGDLLESLKKFIITVKVTAEEENGGSVVHLSFEYEKLRDDVSDPYTLMFFYIQLTKDIEYHLIN